ncbi:hypothetical protein PRIPAC_86810 [Pristionchus pacificus]|uniref:Uncharacterized protein n=1 Tax=Pristionchus pacificus TaxID=54126 RepID=A0A2A6BLF4_PRIPA|nr:hypothetical protein PRIPAC_86810 [Pristionchus pacificus]|eukprot:PDM66678.1 hypothetical protein PRIPAC_48095 [Pristionchus pacificus]
MRNCATLKEELGIGKSGEGKIGESGGESGGGSRFSTTMKFALLISVLIVSCLGMVEVKVSVSGVVRCSKSFDYSVNIWHVNHSQTTENAQQLGRFDIWGVGEEQTPVLDNEIEPMMTIEHSCGADYACVCKEFPQTGAQLFRTTVDFDLENLPSDVVYCDVCEQAKYKRREKAASTKGARIFGFTAPLHH